MMWLQNNLEKKTNNAIFKIDIMLKNLINNQRIEKIECKKSSSKIAYNTIQGCTHKKIEMFWNWIQ